jgi:hypothetical protein
MLGIFSRSYDYARRTRLTNLFEIPVDELWVVPVAEARRRLGLPEGGAAAEVYREIPIKPGIARKLQGEWERYGKPSD